MRLGFGVTLRNFYCTLRSLCPWINDGTYLREDDGSLVPLDEWSGYDNCHSPGCGHYRCEHGFGETWTVSYNRDNPEDVGRKIVAPVGCMNAGCECAGFMTSSEFIGMMQNYSHVLHNAFWELSEIEGVEDVKTVVDVNVRIITKIKNWDRVSRELIYDKERQLREKYPDVPFDFHTQKADDDSIT
jgi:hypothetical protein